MSHTMSHARDQNGQYAHPNLHAHNPYEGYDGRPIIEGNPPWYPSQYLQNHSLPTRSEYLVQHAFGRGQIAEVADRVMAVMFEAGYYPFGIQFLTRDYTYPSGHVVPFAVVEIRGMSTWLADTEAAISQIIYRVCGKDVQVTHAWSSD